MVNLVRSGVAAAVLMSAAAASAQTTVVSPAETKNANLHAYAELLRADVRAQKVAFLTELMEFTDAEDRAFWPIYRAYDSELAAINDERVSGIEEYASNYGKVTDALADKLALKVLELETRRTVLKEKYYARFKAALSATTAARFLQVENQLLLLTDLQIAASLPIVK
jgi:hypothetical protein